jgi:hypothetical protein
MRVRAAQAIGVDGDGLDVVAPFNETALAAALADYRALVGTSRAELDAGEAELAGPRQRHRHDPATPPLMPATASRSPACSSNSAQGPPDLPSRANPCGCVPVSDVQNDGQMTVSRS